MLRRNFLKSIAALPLVGMVAACGKAEPTEAATWYKHPKLFALTNGANVVSLNEVRNVFDYSGPGPWTTDYVLPRWTRMNLPIQLGEGRVLRGLDLPLEDLNKIFTP